MTNQEYAAGLRQLAAWYDEHPDAEQPYEADELDFNLASRSRIAQVIRDFGGKWTKQAGGGLMYFFGSFGPFRLKIYTDQRTVCVARQTGTRWIPEQPAQPGRMVPEFEWDCAPVLEEAGVEEEAAP